MSEINDFKEEIKTYSTEEILLILSDQKDLYSPEEIGSLEEELSTREKGEANFDKDSFIGHTLEEATNETIAAEDKRITDAILQAEADRINKKIDLLKAEGKDGYWQYRVLSLVDKNSGLLPPEELSFQINELGLEGWKLVCAFSNELGHNSRTAGLFGLSAGTNATIDQNILLFERYVKI